MIYNEKKNKLYKIKNDQYKKNRYFYTYMKGRKIIVIVGFPSSGKSTYAKKLLTKYSKNGIIAAPGDCII